MKDLLYKEFKLWWHPGWFLFLFCGALLLLPSWPFFIAFGYIFIAFLNSFFLARANQDILFTVFLPVRKRDTVLARILFIAVIELLQTIVAIPFAIINNSVYLEGNMAGTNTNFAFFGLVLIWYAIFNLIFFPMFYKTAYKTGKPMLMAVLGTVVYAGCVTAAILVSPVLRNQLNGLGTSHLASQLIVLVAGVVFFPLLTWLAYRMSASRFEKVDL